MRLCDILVKTDYELVFGDITKEVKSLEYHSKNVKEESAFFVIDGYFHKGEDYIKEAIVKGASVIVLSKKLADSVENILLNESLENLTVIKVEDVRKALATMSVAFYNNPSGEMQVIGITGTKGKTSTAFMVQHILESAGIKTGIIGTVVCGYKDNYIRSEYTTPQAPQIQKMMREMANNGCKAVVMEVSSQGLKHSRVCGVDFNIGVLTNISKDHIGGFEHENFEEYIECKSKLFDMASRAVINGNCINWKDVVKNKKLKQKIFYGKDEEFDYSCSDISLFRTADILGSKFLIRGIEFVLNIPGAFNAQNALCAISTCRALGVPYEIIKEALLDVKIPGRAELVKLKDLSVIVDYAHNGVAIEALLTSLKEYKPNRLMLVFGCGGNRDKNRRYEMGKAASMLADYIVVTSDNPRNENPIEIIKDITSEMDFCEKVILSIPDRKEAIKRAINDGEKGDIIVIAGKGHETYQIIGNETIHFDDKEVILSCGKDN